MTGKVVPLAAGPTLAEAAEAFLSRRDLDADTIRSYSQTMTVLRRQLGDELPVAALTAEQVAHVIATTWADAAARTWNRHRSAVRSFSAWAAGTGRGWVTADLSAPIDRRSETRDRTRTIDRRKIETLWDRRDIATREKTLWRLLYESAARADSVLSLNIEDLDLDNKRGKITAKGVIVRWVQWH